MKSDFIQIGIQLLIGFVFSAILYSLNLSGWMLYLVGIAMAFSYQYSNHKRIKNLMPLFSVCYIIMKVFVCAFFLFCIAFEYIENKNKRI